MSEYLLPRGIYLTALKLISTSGINIMSKSKDTKKMEKKEPLKTPKEKKEAKKMKEEAKKRQ